LFPGFTDVREIGVGSLAVVFRARESGTSRHVALKLLNIRDASPRAIESFERESIALGALSSHPNIVTLYRTFRIADNRPVLVLELCTGAVADRLRDGSGLPVAEAVSIGIKIAGALETAHRSGILHRDVKPQNILLTEFGEPALADFGVAMLQSSTQTTAGLFDFTTLHAAPELLEGGGTSAATDVYELASTLYQLIAGRSAFRAYEGESPASVILRILRDPVRPLSGAEVPTGLSDLLIRAMSKDKDERPPTAAEFAAELAEIESACGWGATPFLVRESPGPPGSGAAPGPAGGWTPPPVAPPPPRASRAPHGDRRPVDEEVSRPAPVRGRVRSVPPPAPKALPTPPAPVAPVAQPEPAPAAPEPAPAETSPEPAPAAPEPQPEPAPPAPFASAPLAPIAPPEPASSPQSPPVPVWAVREPSPAEPAAPETGPLDQPTAKLTLRAGASSVVVDGRRLQLRTWFKRRTIAWTEVQGFEARVDVGKGGNRQATTGRIVALTANGPVEMPGTRRPLAELRYVRTLLDAYRERATPDQ
jgi:hypothetical protein